LKKNFFIVKTGKKRGYNCYLLSFGLKVTPNVQLRWKPLVKMRILQPKYGQSRKTVNSATKVTQKTDLNK